MTLILCDQHLATYQRHWPDGLVVMDAHYEPGGSMPTAKAKQTTTLPPVEDGWEEIKGEFGETVDLTEQGTVSGVYLGSREIETTGPNGEDRISKIHDFDAPDQISGGTQLLSVWGSHDLDQKLTNEQKGEVVRVDYVKTIPIQGGKQSLKLFRVLVKS